MTLLDFETFYTISKTLNITRAAELLCVTQSTITHRLKNFEDELGYKLFVRQKGKRHIEITAQGEEFLLITKRWLELNEEMELIKLNTLNTLSIASVDSVILMFLPPILKELSKKENKVHINIRTEHTPTIYKLVKNLEVNLGFVSYISSVEGILVKEIVREKFTLVRYCKNPQKQKTIHPSELDPSLEIFLPWGINYKNWHDKWWKGKAPHIVIDSLSMLVNFLDDEMLWAIVPQISVHTLLKNCSLQIYEIIDGPSDWKCYQIQNDSPDNLKTNEIRKFAEVQKQIYAKK